MFRNCLVAALRNLARNKLYAVINIVGLSTGFAAAIFIALFVRAEFSYEDFLPNFERTYLATEIISVPGAKPLVVSYTPAELAGWLKLDFPSVDAVTRLQPERTSLRHADIEANEQIYWADPNFFDVVSLPVAAGDIKTALQQPDGVVLTRTIARKYFGRDDAVGETIEFGRKHAMRVTAVVDDLPSNTHLEMQIFASGRASFSSLAAADAKPPPLSTGNNEARTKTYFRLAPGASPTELQRALPAFISRHARIEGIFNLEFPILPIAEVHLRPEASMGSVDDTKPSGNLATIYAISAVGVLIMLVASINFVNLMTARATRRAVEVGVRKTAGATRHDLVVQFIGESILYALLAMLLAMMLVELLLPIFNAVFDRAIDFDYWRRPALLVALTSLTLAIGVLAGSYPAFILSSFSPAQVLKSTVLRAAGSGRIRQSLVGCQFAVLIGLILVTALIYKQTQYAAHEGLRLDDDLILVIETSCRDALKEAIAALPGVLGAACSYSTPTVPAFNQSYFKPAGREHIFAWYTSVDPGFFELYGLRPQAGRFFSEQRGTDQAAQDNSSDRPDAVVVNETFVSKLGVASPQAAIGQTLQSQLCGARTCEIVGVVPDYAEASVREVIPPTIYRFNPHEYRLLSVKLRGQNLPENLRAIDQLWKQLGDPKPIYRVFVNQRVQQLYLDITRQSQLFSAFAIIALCIACLGLFGLSAFTAERRTKEIGIRKAMGASTGDVMRLLLWQFSKPVLWANLIAWPVSAFIMNRWLQGFAYHIDLAPWLFFASTALALVIALATVSVHCYLVARAKPIHALRYE
jgi:putative ABC transport system permease protein